jgi:hypothetical protein
MITTLTAEYSIVKVRPYGTCALIAAVGTELPMRCGAQMVTEPQRTGTFDWALN